MTELAGGVNGHQPSSLHNPDAGATFLRSKQIIRGHQNSNARAAQSGQQGGELIGGFRVKTGRWLIEQQRLRSFSDRHRDPDFLPHALGVGAHSLLGDIRREPHLR